MSHPNYCLADGGLADAWGGFFFAAIPVPKTPTDLATLTRGMAWRERLLKMSRRSPDPHAVRFVPPVEGQWPPPPKRR